VERVLLGLCQLAETELPQLLQLVRRESGGEEHLGEKVEEQGEVARQASSRTEDLQRAEAVPRDVQLDPAVLEKAGDLEPAVASRPALEHVGKEGDRGPLLAADEPVTGEKRTVKVHGGIHVPGEQEEEAPTGKRRLLHAGGQIRAQETRVRAHRGRLRPRDGSAAAAVFRHEVADRDGVVGEGRRRHPAHVVALHAANAFRVVEVEAPVHGGDRLREAGGHLPRRVPVVRRLRLHLRLGALHFRSREPPASERRDLTANDLLHLAVPRGRVERREHLKQPRIAKLPGDRLRIQAEAGLDQTLVEAGRHAPSQSVGENGQRMGVRVRGGRRPPRHRHPPDLAGAPDGEPPFALLPWLLGDHPGDRLRGARQGSESTRHGGEGRLAVERPDEDEGSVVRVIERVVEAAQAIDRGVLDVAAPADGRVMVRMLAKRDRERLLEQHVERFVLPAFELVAHHGHLGRQVLGAQHRAAHPVGLQLERQVEMLRRQDLVVARAVEPGGGVEVCADPFENAGDRPPFGGVETLRTLEHQVLEQVRRSGVAHRLVSRAHVVHQAHRHDRDLGLRKQQHVQTVGLQPQLLDTALARLNRERFTHLTSSGPL
jgi:hypothetical protein